MAEIRHACREDIPTLVGLIREFAVFEKLEHVCEVDEKSVEVAFFSTASSFQCLLAFIDGECTGYAVFYPVFKTFRGVRSMYLEDLYVIPDARGSGVGIALLRAVARDAAEAGINRLDWQVLDWNIEAIGFYETLGSERDDGNLDFRISGEAFNNLLK